LPQVIAINRKQIESCELRPVAAEQQAFEAAATL
jgi:hypothetical protein